MLVPQAYPILLLKAKVLLSEEKIKAPYWG